MGRKYFKDKKIFQKVIDKMLEYQKMYDEYDKTSLVHEKAMNHLDNREVLWYVISKRGFLPKEELFKAINEEEIKLGSDDSKIRFKALDEYFDRTDSFDATKGEYNTYEQVLDLVLRTKCTQLNSKLLYDGNKDYKKYRYDDNPRKLQEFDAHTSADMTNSQIIINQVKDNGFDLNLLKWNDEKEGRLLDIIDKTNKLKEDFYESKCSINDYVKGKTDHISLSIPEYNYKLKEYSKLDNPPKEYKNYIGFDGQSIFKQNFDLLTDLNDILNNGDSVSARFFNNEALKANIEAIDNIYIDGVQLSELVKRDNGMSYIDYQAKCNLAIIDAAKDGKAVDLVGIYNDNGTIHTNIVPVKFDKGPFAEKVNKEHDKRNPLRELFDWGPFKIKRKDFIGDSFKRNQEKIQERHAKILEHRNTVILDKINNVQVNKKFLPGLEMKFSEKQVEDPSKENNNRDYIMYNINKTKSIINSLNKNEFSIVNDEIFKEDVFISNKDLGIEVSSNTKTNIENVKDTVLENEIKIS